MAAAFEHLNLQPIENVACNTATHAEFFRYYKVGAITDVKDF